MKNKRVKRSLFVGLLAIAAATIAAGRASAATLTVCPSGCAFTQIAPALAAENNGDTISIGLGTYDGGLTVDKSVKLVGAGSDRTTISGGGPVLTIGTFDAASEPTVTIDGVTITGGVTRSSWATGPGDGVFALGGGVQIPPSAGFGVGATLNISNSVISGNRVAPSVTAPVGPPCPSGRCPFARASGGGIDSFGTLTLTNSTVSNNRIGTASGLSALASDVEGAAIHNWAGALTISNTVVVGNQASASAPNGRGVEGGGISISGGTLSMSNSAVTNNSAMLTAALPGSVDVEAHGGGIAMDDGVAATISNTTVSGNSAAMTNSVGNAEAFSGGLHINPAAVLSNDVIANDHVTSATLAGSTGSADGSAGAGEINGTMSNIRLSGNTVDVSAANGDATGAGGATVFDGGTITNGVVNDNRVDVSSPRGSVSVSGGAIFVAVGLTLRNTPVTGNTASVTGAGGNALGGGIYDAAFPFGPDGPPGGPLVLQNSDVTGNVLIGSVGVSVEGGGLYIQDEPLARTNSAIAQNTPDDCFGC